MAYFLSSIIPVLTVPILDRPATELGGEGFPLSLCMAGPSATFELFALECTEMGGVSGTRGLLWGPPRPGLRVDDGELEYCAW